VLQEDNDPEYRNRLCTEWKTRNGIRVLDWLFQSPDGNLIENVWSIMKYKLREKCILSLKALVWRVREI
ncbi:hypothetical protein WN51_10322, partial [Melipona quadrifasciata]